MIAPRALLVALALAACKEGRDPERLDLNFGSFEASPAILLDFRINGKTLGHFPTVESSRADTETPRGNGGASLSYPPGDPPGRITITAEWVELFTHKAWRAEFDLRTADFTWHEVLDQIRVTPVFGPNGLIIIASDPIPKSADVVTKDIARLCGTRAPEADFDFARRPDQIAQLPELLEFDFPPVTDPECPYPED